ncbi:MAG: nucleotidyltransferase domain-containing protein [Vicinamibacterales bacterium]
MATTVTLPEPDWPSSLPALHRAFVRTAIARFPQDQRVLGLAAGGSFRTNTLDEYSDLDFVVVVTPASWPAILDEREALVRPLGPLLGAFTGEHVGEPRLLVTLFGPPLLHVDFKFVRPEDLAQRVEDPVILWERDGAITHGLAGTHARFPLPDPQWIEDRFWIWVHYVATKIGRGELFEALDALAFLRARVLGPPLLESAGVMPAGVRRLESAAGVHLATLRHTVAAHDRSAAVEGLRAAVALYRQLRPATLRRREAAEAEAVRYLDAIAQNGSV